MKHVIVFDKEGNIINGGSVGLDTYTLYKEIFGIDSLIEHTQLPNPSLEYVDIKTKTIKLKEDIIYDIQPVSTGSAKAFIITIPMKTFKVTIKGKDYVIKDGLIELTNVLETTLITIQATQYKTLTLELS